MSDVKQARRTIARQGRNRWQLDNVQETFKCSNSLYILAFPIFPDSNKDLHASTFKIGQDLFPAALHLGQARPLNRLLLSLKLQTSTPFQRDRSRQMNTSPSLNPARRWPALHLSPSQLGTSSLWTLRGKAGHHVDAEAVLVVFHNHWRRDDLLLVVKDDRFPLPANLDHLHLAGVWVDGRAERLEPAGVQLLPFDLPALPVGHQLRSWGRGVVLRLDPVQQRQHEYEDGGWVPLPN